MMGVAVILSEEEVDAVVKEAFSVDNNYNFDSSRAAVRKSVY